MLVKDVLNCSELIMTANLMQAQWLAEIADMHCQLCSSSIIGQARLFPRARITGEQRLIFRDIQLCISELLWPEQRPGGEIARPPG